VIWAAQTMIFEIEIGLWSGMKRKMEIAESHCQVVYTVCSRGFVDVWPELIGL
jgi:hypothetical protein